MRALTDESGRQIQTMELNQPQAFLRRERIDLPSALTVDESMQSFGVVINSRHSGDFVSVFNDDVVPKLHRDHPLSDDASPIVASHLHHRPRRRYKCSTVVSPPVQAGDKYNGHKVKRYIATGAYADAWIVDLAWNASTEAVMKVIRPGCNYSVQDVYRECVFARLAKQKAPMHVADCLDVGQGHRDGGAFDFLIFENAKGHNLASPTDWTAAPAALRYLHQVFDLALMNYNLIETLRTPSTDGVSLWHLDLLLYNLLLDKHSALVAIDYNLVEMCCADDQCKRIRQNLASSMRGIHPHAFDRAALVNLLKPCSSHASAYKEALDGALIESWIRNTMALLFDGGVGFADWFQEMNWRQKIRNRYSSQWSANCGRKGAACKNLLSSEIHTFWNATAGKPEWPASAAVLLQSLRDAKSSLFQLNPVQKRLDHETSGSSFLLLEPNIAQEEAKHGTSLMSGDSELLQRRESSEDKRDQHEPSERASVVAASRSSHMPWRKRQCGPSEHLVKLGDVVNGYKLKTAVGGGAHADAWLVSLPGNSSVEAIMKVIRPDCNYSMTELYKECAFARLAKQKANTQIADCLDVGEAQGNHSAVRFLVFEKAHGKKLGILAKWENPPPALRSLRQAVATSLRIHDLTDQLRNPADGVSLWHLDMLLYNLLLYGNDEAPLLTAIDYNLAEMCCVDSECDRVTQGLALSMKGMRSHVFPQQDLLKMVRPCSSISSTYMHDLDHVLTESWIRNTMALLVEGGFKLADWFSHIAWEHGHIRSAYSKQWSRICKTEGAACRKLFANDFHEFRRALGQQNPEWPASSDALFHMLLDTSRSSVV